jgi:DNA-binding NtrC family response regulator
MNQPLRGVTVLVVEDNDETLSATAMLLTDAFGCNVLSAPTAGDALRVIESGAPIDLVFSDLALPDIDGLTLAHAIQQRLPDVPLVLTTGYPDMLDAINSIGAVAVDKPYTLDQLETVFTEQLGPRRLSQSKG